MKKAGLLKHYLSSSTTSASAGPTLTQSEHKQPYFSLPSAIRRGSLENLAASSQNASSAVVPPGGRLSNLAEVVCSVRQPFVSGRDEETEIDEDDLTDQDSDQLISDEEDDAESGFLSQF